MTPAPFGTYAAKFAERGYVPLAITPGTKKPAFNDWSRLTPDNWDDIARPPGHLHDDFHYLDSYPSHHLGLRCGHRGIIAADTDTDDPAIVAAIKAILPPSPSGKRGRKGETWFYRCPNIGTHRWSINGVRVFEILGDGAQTVIPPSRHPDTRQPYEWLGTALSNIEPEELPLLPDDIVERISDALKPFGWHPDPEPRLRATFAPADGETVHRQLNNLALANLDAWAPALGLAKLKRSGQGYVCLASWRASSKPDKERTHNVGIHPSGIRDFGIDESYTPLDFVMEAKGYDLDTAFRYLSERLNFNSELVISFPLQPEQEPEPEPKPEPKPIRETADFDKLTHVPGLVGEIIEWICDTARRPNRVLALGAAITVVGTLIGRRAGTPTRSGTHLYLAAIGPSGVGKQHPMKCIRTLMRSASAEVHVSGPTSFFSVSALENFLKAKPLSIVMIDEVGAFLESVTRKGANEHKTAISALMRSAWGASFDTIETSHRAQEAGMCIRSPAFSVYGVSTPDEWADAIRGNSEQNGFLNRWLRLPASMGSDDADPKLDPDQVPSGLAAALSALYVWSGELSTARINDPGCDHKPDVMPWADDAAKQRYVDLVKEIDAYGQLHPDEETYFRRTAEYAVRLATIRAAGRWGYGAEIVSDDMEWGAALAWAAGKGMADEMLDHVPQTDDGLWSDRVLKYVRRKGPVKVRKIQQHMKGRIKSARIKEILSQLVDAGEISRIDDEFR